MFTSNFYRKILKKREKYGLYLKHEKEIEIYVEN